MPVKRRVSKRFADLPDQAVQWLDGEDGQGFWFFAQSEASLAAFWNEHRDQILEEWVAEHPGTRPARWWQYDAPRSPMGTYPGCHYDGQLPEPRRRMGGVGTPAHEVLAYVPQFNLGIPMRWVDHWFADYYNGRAKDIHGKPIGQEFVGRPFAGLPIDPDNPPRYESQATYLRRHKLLLPGERERLRAGDWRAESVPSR